ncbi:MAG: aspartate-alanine antiporter [Candidatus Competibacteraceae bacterium]|nr:aspartate-alanine antiporter [Candidatus Competibacteraceae bacterium]
MQLIHSLFEHSPIIALFVCVALGFAIGKIRIGQLQLGGIPGTLFAAILIGQIGVEVNEGVKTIAFALFIYSLGYVSGPQFFSSLGRSTLNQVHLSVFTSLVVFVTVWSVAQIFDLDKGTAAGLLAGATTESASVGTASETLLHLGLAPEESEAMNANIGVAYAVTYFFGFTLVVFFVSTIAPRLLGIDLKAAAKEFEKELGNVGDELAPGQEPAVRDVVARAYRVTKEEAAGCSLAALESRIPGSISVQGVVRRGRLLDTAPERTLAIGDRLLLFGKVDALLSVGEFIGEETAYAHGLALVGETREVVLTNRDFVGETISAARAKISPEQLRSVYLSKLTRSGQLIEMRPNTRLQAGDVLTIYGTSEGVESATKLIGYAIDRGIAVDYIYLALGIIAGILLGMVSVDIAGSPVSLHTGGGCLLSGLVFGWLRSRHPTFGSLPEATALHLRDFGLAMFIASIGLATGPQAVTLLMEKGILLPLLAIIVVLIPLITSMYYARYVLKMNPVVICGALAGLLTCTAGLNATVQQAESETPVLGYTVPYAIANVLLTLLGPVIVLTA